MKKISISILFTLVVFCAFFGIARLKLFNPTQKTIFNGIDYTGAKYRTYSPISNSQTFRDFNNSLVVPTPSSVRENGRFGQTESRVLGLSEISHRISHRISQK